MVYDLTQDTTGVMWFATRQGPCSYDGKTWRSYSQVIKPYSSGAAFVHCDSKGTLWLVAGRGPVNVWRFNGESWDLLDNGLHPPQIGYFSAFDVSYDEKSPLIALGTVSKGLYIYQDSCWTHVTVDQGLPSDEIRDVVWWKEQCLAATSKGLCVIRNGKAHIGIQALLPVTNPDILTMTLQPARGDSLPERLWLMGHEWLGVLEQNVFRMLKTGFRISAYNVSGRSFIYPTPEGDVYFGNPFYLYHLDPKNPEHLEQIGRDNGLIADGATGLLVDRERNTWICGYRGITKMPSRRFVTYSISDGLFDNEVSAAIEMSPGSYLFAHHGGLTFSDGKSFTVLDINKDQLIPYPEVRIQDVDLDQRGNVWMAGTLLGIGRMDRDRRIKWYKPIPGENYSSVVVLADGSVYASSDRCLFRLNENDRFVQVAVPSLNMAGIRKLFAGRDSSLISATYSNGLLIKKGSREIVLKSAVNELDNNIYAYFRDRQNQEWVGSINGLFRIGNNQLVKVDSAGLRIDRPVFLIMGDSTGALWFGTDNGAYRWNGKRLDHFTTMHGFSGQEINRDAGFVDSYGIVWIGTNLGVTKYNPAFDRNTVSIPAPLLSILNMTSEGDTFSVRQNLKLPSGRQNLSFQFHATSLIDEENILYSCQLEGFDSDWSPPFRSLDETYSYNNLDPGTYRFCVKASNSLGIWSDPVCSASIRVIPPFWRQWWFLAGEFLLFLLLIGLLVWFVVMRGYNRRLEKAVAIKTRALRRSERMLRESNSAKDNFFSIIAHDLRSPFNAILGMLELLTTEYHGFSDKERQRILLNLRNSSTRTINLLDNLLTWAQAQKGLLPFQQERFDVMELINENLALFESSAVTKEITLHPPSSEIVLVYADRNMINTVIRNLISNAIKFTPAGGTITVRITREHPHEVTISVADTGVGIDDETMKTLFHLDGHVSTKGTNEETGSGLGLILSKDFVTKNKGRIWVTSEIETGSTFWFTLPVRDPGE